MIMQPVLHIMADLTPVSSKLFGDVAGYYWRCWMRFLFSLSSFQTVRSLARNGLHCRCVRFTVVESTVSRQLRDGGRRTSRRRSTEFWQQARAHPFKKKKKKKERRKGWWRRGGGGGCATAGCCFHLLRLAALPVSKVATSCSIFCLFPSFLKLLFRVSVIVPPPGYRLHG